jgi:hypothetical protein
MKDPLLNVLLGLELEAKDHAVFGSGPLFMHGLKDSLRDLDVIARGRAWAQALDLSRRGVLLPPETPPSGRGLVIRHPEESIEIFDQWPDVDVDELIDSAETIDGIQFVQVGDVLRWKIGAGRDKDERDVRAAAAVARGRTSRPW